MFTDTKAVKSTVFFIVSKMNERVVLTKKGLKALAQPMNYGSYISQYNSYAYTIRIRSVPPAPKDIDP